LANNQEQIHVVFRSCRVGFFVGNAFVGYAFVGYAFCFYLFFFFFVFCSSSNTNSSGTNSYKLPYPCEFECLDY